MTDNEIIKSYELCFDEKGATYTCAICPYHEFGELCKVERDRDAFDLINHQKAEIERYKERCSKCGEKTTKAILNLQELLAEQKAEIERLQKHIQEGIVLARQLPELASAIQAEAIKEFADNVHTEIHQALESNYKARAERMAKPNIDMADEFISYCDGKIAALRGIDDFVNETYKEMVGENNAE